MARNSIAECAVRLRGGEPRPLFSGERGQRDDKTQSHLRRWRPARARKLQRVSGGQGSVFPRAKEAAGVTRKPRAYGTGMAAARAEGTRYEGQSTNRQSAGDDRRPGGNESAQPHGERGNRFFRHEPEDEA